jgi:hypothetical protein
MYQLVYGIKGRVSTIRRLSDGGCIPVCQDNTDYQEFLEWNGKQATPLKLDSIDAGTVASEDAARALQIARALDVDTNLPSWKAVSDAIDAATTLAAMKIIVKKMARVLYWLEKNKVA